jgi:hypothetical protein
MTQVFCSTQPDYQEYPFDSNFIRVFFKIYNYFSVSSHIDFVFVNARILFVT